MNFIKFLKIALPVTTATSATVFTTLLVSSFNKKDQPFKTQDLDSVLNDFKLPDENYEDSKKFYVEKGTGDGKTSLDEKTTKEIADLLDRVADLKDPKNLNSNLEHLQKEIDKLVQTSISDNKNQLSRSEDVDSETLGNELQKPTTNEISEVGESNLPEGTVEESYGLSMPEESDLKDAETDSSPQGAVVGNQKSPEITKEQSEFGTQEKEPESIVENGNSDGDSQDSLVNQQEKQIGDIGQQEETKAQPESQELGEAKTSQDLRSEADSEERVSTSEKGEDVSTQEGKEKLDENDINKWKELGDKLSSISETLKNLINF